MNEADRLRDLASWFLKFAERAENPEFRATRLRTAEDLEVEAKATERRQQQLRADRRITIRRLLGS